MIFSHRTIRTASLFALACCCAPTVVRGQVVGEKQHYEHEFPPTLAFKTDWIEFERNPTPKVIQSLLRKDAEGKHVVPRDERNYTSTWVTIDHWLKQHPETLAKLRIVQDADAPRQLFSAKRSGDPARLMSVYRTYPWAAAVHESLVESGEYAASRIMPMVPCLN